jgi:hypothetical protein
VYVSETNELKDHNPVEPQKARLFVSETNELKVRKRKGSVPPFVVGIRNE